MTIHGILAQSSGEIFGNKIFYLSKGRRHWVQKKAWMEENGFDFPKDVVLVSDELLLAFLPGQPASCTVDLNTAIISNVGDAREATSSMCSGRGLEVGAGSSPFPVPLACSIEYGDMYSYNELLQNAYPGQPLYDIVSPTIKTSIDNFENIHEESLNFIVACHVIEHTRDPIGAIVNAYAKLRTGGHLVLIIPDKLRTFDNKRPLTELGHLIDDFAEVHLDRDKDHYKEFFSLADGFSVDKYQLETKWIEEWNNNYSIHFHTWTYETFGQMVDWIIKNVVPYNVVWSHRALPDGIEFYYVLNK